MIDSKDIWYIAGRLIEGNTVKQYLFYNTKNQTKWVLHHNAASFVKNNVVINCNSNGSNLVGVGIQLTSLPRFVKGSNGNIQQVGGYTIQQVQQLAYSLLKEYQEKQVTSNNKVNDNKQKVNYVTNKLKLINNLIYTALKMKDLTNGMAENGVLYKYLRQIDIDNAGDMTLAHLVRTREVNGLADGLKERLQNLNKRMVKYNLQNEVVDGIILGNKCRELLVKCEDIKKLHIDTKRLIELNKKNEKDITANVNNSERLVYAVITYIRNKQGNREWELDTGSLTKKNAIEHSNFYINSTRAIFNCILGIRVYEVTETVFKSNDIERIMKGKLVFDKPKTIYYDLKNHTVVYIERNPKTYDRITNAANSAQGIKVNERKISNASIENKTNNETTKTKEELLNSLKDISDLFDFN